MEREGGARSFLVTGSTGFLGKLIVELLLRRRAELGVSRIYALVRPTPDEAAAERFRRVVVGSPCFAHLPPELFDCVEVVEGDLCRPGCDLSDADTRTVCEGVTHVLHSAASVDFDLPIAQAATANVTASLGILGLAQRMQRLQRLVAVSTAYVTPHPGDGVPIKEELAGLPAPAADVYEAILSGEADEEELLAGSGHPNTYTFTKCLSEHLVLERRDGVPVTLVRPSIISASQQRPFSGWIDSPAAFAAFVAMIGSGYLRAVIADPKVRLNVVPADWVAEQVLDAALEEAPGASARVRHTVASQAASLLIELCQRSIIDFFRANPAGRPVAVHYCGPPGLRFRIADGLHNQAALRAAMLVSRRARRRGRRLLDRMSTLHRLFPYFTRHTFHFEAQVPFDPEAFDHGGYVETICEGVARHLLRRTASDAPLRPNPAPAR